MVYVFQISNIFATVLHFSTQRTLLLASHSGDDIGVLEQNSRRDCLGNYVQCAQSVWAVHLARNYHLVPKCPHLYINKQETVAVVLKILYHGQGLK